MSPHPPSPSPGSIGDQLRTQRLKLGIGLREMAQRLSIAPAHMTDIEKNRRTPSEELLLKIAETYQIPERELRAGWQRPDPVVEEIASQTVTTAEKVPVFLRSARKLTSAQWDQLIRQADKLSQQKPRK